jgi:hypothetical protein
LKENVVESSLNPIKNFNDFLTTNYAFLSVSVQNLKETYGESIKYKTIELLIKIREDDIEKEDRAEVYKTCESVYKTTSKCSTKSKNFNVFSHVNQNIEAETLRAASFIEASTEDESLSLSFLDKSSMRSQSSFVGTGLDGYLDAEKDEFLSGVKGLLHGDIKFERKFFSIKKGMFYCYKDKSAETSLFTYIIKDITQCIALEGEEPMFSIKIKQKDGEKESRYRADSPEKRDQWVACIKLCMLTPDAKAMFEVSESEAQFYKDELPMFQDIEELPALTFVLVKPEEPRKRQSTTVTPAGGKAKEETKAPSIRRKSFDITDDPKNFSMIIPSDQRPQGCWGKFCITVGKNKKVGDELIL